MSNYTAEQATEHGMLSIDEVQAIKEVVRMLPQDAIVVNIGSGAGTSILSVLEERDDVFVFDVDIRVQSQSRQTLHDSGFASQNRVAHIVGKSWNVGENFPILVDMVFVDGAHYKEAVLLDIEAWLSKIKDGGFVLFHDYQHPNIPELTEVVDEAMQGQEVCCTARYLIGYRV